MTKQPFRKLKSVLTMTREEWLQHRMKGIGGSDVSVIFGLNQYKRPLELYLEKSGELDINEEFNSEPAYWGTQLESLIAEEFKKRHTELIVRKNNFILQSIDNPFMLANLDRELVDKDGRKGVLEIKTASAFLSSKWGQDEVPPEYMLQVQHYLSVTGYNFAYIALLLGGQRYDEWKIERDDELIQVIIDGEKEFIERLENKQPPGVDGSNASKGFLDLLYPGERAKAEPVVQLPKGTVEYLKALEEVKDKEKEIKETRTYYENKIKELLQEQTTGQAGSYTVSWKPVETTRLDTKAFKAENLDLFEKYSKTTTTRKFTYKKKEK